MLIVGTREDLYKPSCWIQIRSKSKPICPMTGDMTISRVCVAEPCTLQNYWLP